MANYEADKDNRQNGIETSGSGSKDFLLGAIIGGLAEATAILAARRPVFLVLHSLIGGIE